MERLVLYRFCPLCWRCNKLSAPVPTVFAAVELLWPEYKWANSHSGKPIINDCSICSAACPLRRHFELWREPSLGRHCKNDRHLVWSATRIAAYRVVTCRVSVFRKYVEACGLIEKFHYTNFPISSPLFVTLLWHSCFLLHIVSVLVLRLLLCHHWAKIDCFAKHTLKTHISDSRGRALHCPSGRGEDPQTCVKTYVGKCEKYEQCRVAWSMIYFSMASLC